MNKITQEEFNALPIVNGLRQCPSCTDYSLISSFGEWCSFGERCSFGKRCSFSDGCSFGKGCSFGEFEFINRRIVSVLSVGESGSASCWKGKDGIYRFQIGCRFADEETTIAAIVDKYGEDTIYHDAIKLLKRIADKESV